MGKTRKHQNLLEGSLILAVATLLVKVLGMIYKIPLNNILDGLGAGYYSTAYDLYLPVYSLAMAGLPVAVSRMVAENVAKKRYKDVRRILKIAQRAFLTTGTIGTAAIIILTYFYLYNGSFRSAFNISAGRENVYSIVLIAFSILFCCIMSSYRGYYEGLRNMYPTAVSQVIEAAGKLAVGLFLAWGAKYFCMTNLGYTESESMPFAAAGAVLGVTLGSAAGAVYLIIRHRLAGDRITEQELELSPPATDSGRLFKALVVIAIPVVVGSLVRDVASLVDLTTVKARLARVVESNPNVVRDTFGLDIKYKGDEIVTYLYGCFKGYAYSIYNLVPTITSVIGVSAIPALSTAWATREKNGITDSIESILRLTAVISFPAGLGITVLSGPILNLLYSSRPNEVLIATPVLSVLGFAAVFAGMAVPMTNMLQAIGKQNVPVITMAIGVVLKIVTNYIFVGIPSINVVGAPLGTGVCYGFIMVANFWCLKKYSIAEFSIRKTVIKPALSAVVCAATAWGSYKLFAMFIHSGKMCAALCIILAAIVYALCLMILKTFSENDILMLPKGEKLVKVLAKFGFIG